MLYYVYILRCRDETLYCGIATNVKRRVEEHLNGRNGAKYTAGRRPVVLIYAELCVNKSLALKKEIEIKSWSRKKKLAYIESEIVRF